MPKKPATTSARYTNSSISTVSYTSKNLEPGVSVTDHCPSCGATIPPGITCDDLFTRAQLAELQNPACYTVHHLSVPCYMLQHKFYTQRGWLEVRELLRRFIEEDLTPSQVLRHHSQDVDSGRRAWSFTRGEIMPGLDQIAWSMTISSIRLDAPEYYCDDIRAWAAAIVRDTQDFISGFPAV